MKNIKFYIIFLSIVIVLIIASIPLLARAAGRFCFWQGDCNVSGCPSTLWCADDQQPNCFVFCAAAGSCGFDEECYGIKATERCGYGPLYPSCNISASDTDIYSGESVTINWSSNAKSCSAPNGSSNCSDSMSVSPSSTTTYTLTGGKNNQFIKRFWGHTCAPIFIYPKSLTF